MERSGLRSALILWVRWVAATGLGWILGFAVAVLLSELLLMPLLHEETNLLVGLSVGGVVSALQMAAVRPWIRLRAGWVAGGMAMLGPPFVLIFLFEELAMDFRIGLPALVFWSVVVSCGLAGAAVQAFAMRPQVLRWRWWVAGAAVSWGPAVALSGVVDFLGAGLVLGVSGGALMVWFAAGASADGMAVVAAGP